MKMDDLEKPVFKKLEQEESEKFRIKINDLPELPFELILSYLSLEDRIKLRRVSRKWFHVINSSRPTTLCYSLRPRGFIHINRRIITGAFAKNFISSPSLSSFFQTFGHSILSSLKRLCFCKIRLSPENMPAFFQTINSFDQLEELGLFRIDYSVVQGGYYLLNLPMLKSVTLKAVYAIKKLTLDAPRLQKIELWNRPDIELVHGESVKKLVTDRLDQMEVKKLVNLQTLHCGGSPIDSTLLSTFKRLKEIHWNYPGDTLSNIFEQKKRYGRCELKIYLRGYLLNGPNDPAIGFLEYRLREYLSFLTENQSRLAEETWFYPYFDYSEIRAMAPGLEIGLLNRFPDLQSIRVDVLVGDVDRFLRVLKSLDNILDLEFFGDHQPQELFDRLPAHSAIQELTIWHYKPADLNFLFGLKGLIELVITKANSGGSRNDQAEVWN